MAVPDPAAPVLAVVVNGKAGALLDQPALERLLAECGLTALFIAPDLGSLPQRIEAAVGSGAAMIVVAGGDGTVACAAHALAGTDRVLGILPFGTMNLLARDLGIPAGDLAAAVRLLAEGAVRRIDLAEVNGHGFLCASMLGLPAQIGRVREQTRSGAAGGWSRPARAFARLSARRARLRLDLRIDALRLPIRAASVTVTLGRLDDAAGWRLLRRRRLDGGELGVYVVPALDPPSLLRLLLGLLRGGWRSSRAVQEHVGAQIMLTSAQPAIRVMNDGELLLLAPPLHYRVRPGALRVMAPRA